MAQFHALFCTAQIPADKINKLLQAAEQSSKAGNVWTLIRNNAQKSAEKPTEQPVEDFETSFKKASLETLGKFCKDKFSQDNPKSQKPYIADEDYAVMDERTLKDDTILLVKYDVWTERIDPNDPSDEDDKFKQLEGWRSIRVDIDEATDTIDAIEYLDLGDAIANIKPEDNGVVKFNR